MYYTNKKRFFFPLKIPAQFRQANSAQSGQLKSGLTFAKPFTTLQNDHQALKGPCSSGISNMQQICNCV